jgi:hypothetical protein
MTNLVVLEMLLILGIVVITAVLLVIFMLWRKRLRER